MYSKAHMFYSQGDTTKSDSKQAEIQRAGPYVATLEAPGPEDEECSVAAAAAGQRVKLRLLAREVISHNAQCT
jgi:hypothetical protein